MLVFVQELCQFEKIPYIFTQFALSQSYTRAVSYRINDAFNAVSPKKGKFTQNHYRILWKCHVNVGEITKIPLKLFFIALETCAVCVALSPLSHECWVSTPQQLCQRTLNHAMGQSSRARGIQASRVERRVSTANLTNDEKRVQEEHFNCSRGDGYRFSSSILPPRSLLQLYHSTFFLEHPSEDVRLIFQPVSCVRSHHSTIIFEPKYSFLPPRQWK